MPTLICQAKNNPSKVVLAVQIELDINWTKKSQNKTEVLRKGNYLIRDGTEKYQITEKEFEDTYLIRKIIT